MSNYKSNKPNKVKDKRKSGKKNPNSISLSKDTNTTKQCSKTDSAISLKSHKIIDFDVICLMRGLDAKFKPNSDDSLFREIKNKLDTVEYTQDELINDMKDLINKNPFIEEFNDHQFIKKDSFEIFQEEGESFIYFILNLLNFINIINAVHYYTKDNPNQFPEILNKLGINFSWVIRDKKLVDVIMLTPKSSVLYNYISTHGNMGIENKKFKLMAQKFCTNTEKYKIDNGYSFEELSVSHLIEMLGKESFEIRPNIMYYMTKDLADKLKELKLIKLDEGYKIAGTPSKIYHGFNETDFIVSMLNEVKFEPSCNLREIVNHDIKIINKSGEIVLEKDNIYVFEIKILIQDIIDKLNDIEKRQNRFINALKRVKINGKFPNKGKKFKSILMCDHNPVEAKEKAENSVIKNKNVIYSSPQVGITVLNRLNNNIRDLHKEVGNLKGQKKMQDNKIKMQDNKIIMQDNKINYLTNEVEMLKQEIKMLKSLLYGKTEMKSESVQGNELISVDKIKIDNNKAYDLCLKELDNVFINELISIYSILENKNELSLNKDTFEKAYNCFKSILEKMLKIKNDLLYLKLSSFIDGKGNTLDYFKIEEMFTEKIKNSEACSIYYEILKNIIFGVDGKSDWEMLTTLNSNKKDYVKKLLGFIEIFENNQKVKDIEIKLLCAILYMQLNIFGYEKMNSLLTGRNKNDMNNRNIMIMLITSLNLINVEYDE